MSISRIMEFHQKQMPLNVNWKDQLGIELVGCGSQSIEWECMCQEGKASYPSSVIMNIAPARVAGVEDIVLVSPTSKW